MYVGFIPSMEQTPMGFSEPVASRGGDCVPEVLILEDMTFIRELLVYKSLKLINHDGGGMMSFRPGPLRSEFQSCSLPFLIERLITASRY